MPKVLELLAEQGITRLLVEGGAKIHGSFLRSQMFDELHIYRAPTVIGGDGASLFSDIQIKTLADRCGFALSSTQSIGDDTLEIYKCSQD